jgi:abortive infection bacteriophage resistance protein
MAKQFQRRRFLRNRPIRNKNCMWSICLFLQFKEISFAYEVLSNAEKRETYDRYGLQGLKEGAGSSGTCTE